MWPEIVAYFIFRTTVLFEPAAQPLAAPSIRSVLIILSTLMILAMAEQFLKLHVCLPHWSRFARRVIVELAMIFISCRLALERVIQKLYKYVLNMYTDMGADALPTALTMLVIVVWFWYSGEANNVMTFVRSITAKFQDQVMANCRQRRCETAPVCPPSTRRPVCPTSNVCTMQSPATVTCCSTAVQEPPCQDDNRCPAGFQCMQPPVTDQDDPCRDDSSRCDSVERENVSCRTRTRSRRRK
jgi:hypothetical protein